MAVLMAERERIDPRMPTLFGDAIEGHRERRDDGVGGGPTLDETIVGAWEGLTAQVAVACPLCADGTLRPVDGRSDDAAGGRCDHCGAQLA
jgi:hypothetical protein